MVIEKFIISSINARVPSISPLAKRLSRMEGREAKRRSYVVPEYCLY